MLKSLSKILVWALVAAMANLPWEAAADFVPGASGAATPSIDAAMPPQNVPAQATTPASLDQLKYIGSFADVFQQLQKSESAAIAAMIEENSFRLKAQTLYGLFINRLMESEWFSQIIQEKGAEPSIPATLESQKVVTESPKIIPESQAPNTKANSAKYESLLEKLGLPSEANEDALLATIAIAMQENGQKLKPIADQRNAAEKNVSALLTTLQSLAKTEDEKTLALGADAIVHIRRYSGFPMRAIDSAIRDNPQCAGDLFKDHDLFKYLSAMVANKKDGITKGALAVAKVLNCADMVQTLALDSGIALEWIRLNENFAAAQYDTARNRIREWLFGMALMIGDVHQVAGMTGAQALVQLAGDTSLVGPGSWLVRDGVFLYNSSSGAMDYYALREEPYVPQPPTPPTPLQLGTNIEMSGPDQSTLLKQAVEGTSKKAPGSAKAMVLKNFKPPEYLDLTTPFGFSFRELQKSCEWHAPIVPATGTPPRYSIMDFIVSAAPDHVGMGLCSKAEMFANGGYCKRIVCEAPEQFFAPSAPPTEAISNNQAICSLPMPGLMSACEVGQQVSKEIHALAAGDDSCPANPWREGEDGDEPTPDSGQSPDDSDDANKEDDEEDKNKNSGNNNDGPPPPQECKGLGCKLVGTEGDKQIWETSDGDIIIHIVVKSTGDNGTPEVEDVNEINRTPGGEDSGDESGDSGDPISRVTDGISDAFEAAAEAIRRFFSGGSSDDSSDDRASSKDPNVIAYGSGAVRLPGDGGRATGDANSPGGATKPGISVWSKMLDKLNPNPVMAKILGKFKFNKAAKKASLFEWDEFSNCAYSKDPMMCDVITAYTQAYSEVKKENAEFFSQIPTIASTPVPFTDIADALTSDIKTDDDVERVLRVIIDLKKYTRSFIGKFDIMIQGDREKVATLDWVTTVIENRLQNHAAYGQYKERIIKRANDVLSNPKFASVAHQSFALAYGIKTTDVDFYIAFTKAVKKAKDDALKITSFTYNKLEGFGKPALGLAYPKDRTIGLSLPVALWASHAYKNVKLRDVLAWTQVHEMLHIVAFNLLDSGYTEAQYPGLILDNASHVAMFYISLDMKHSIDSYAASHLMGSGYSNFDHLLYGDNHGEHVPPQRKGSGGVGGFFGKDCTPDAPVSSP